MSHLDAGRARSLSGARVVEGSLREQALARLTAPAAQFEIIRQDVRGRELEVFANREPSLGRLLEASSRFGDREYLVTAHHRITFARHLDLVSAMAAALSDRYGVEPGDRVAIYAANSPSWIVAFWAATSLGALVVGMNSMWASEEIRYAVELTRPTVLFADAPRRELVGPIDLPVIDIDAQMPSLMERYAGAKLRVIDVDEDDPAVILFTSGTTGRPKGATHSHRNVICAAWFHMLNDALATELGAPPQNRRFLLATPLFHIAGLHNLAVVRLAVGDTAVVNLGRFDIDKVVRLIERERITNWGAVPTMIHRLVARAEQGALEGVDLSSLRSISVNSAPSSQDLKERLRVLLPEAGGSLGTTYGLTESSTAATLASASDLLANPETVGRPVPTMEVAVRDASGHPVPAGVEGEVHLRGAQMLVGYWNDPVATSAAFDGEGWFRTGDLGSLAADGQLRIFSRRSDLILRGGENVYPAEIENHLTKHPAVLECIVIGVPDDDFGEVVAAVVVVHDDSKVDEVALLEHLRPRLARFKLPTQWVVSTVPLPRNATGKVIRKEVVTARTAGPTAGVPGRESGRST